MFENKKISIEREREGDQLIRWDMMHSEILSDDKRERGFAFSNWRTELTVRFDENVPMTLRAVKFYRYTEYEVHIVSCIADNFYHGAKTQCDDEIYIINPLSCIRASIRECHVSIEI